jgi:hypothetical protein
MELWRIHAFYNSLWHALKSSASSLSIATQRAFNGRNSARGGSDCLNNVRLELVCTLQNSLTWTYGGGIRTLFGRSVGRLNCCFSWAAQVFLALVSSRSMTKYSLLFKKGRVDSLLFKSWSWSWSSSCG